jgi:hypothetical protein
VAVGVISHLPDLTGGDDRFSSSALQLHWLFRTADGGSCSINAGRTACNCRHRSPTLVE